MASLGVDPFIRFWMKIDWKSCNVSTTFSNGGAFDSRGRTIKLYKDVRPILADLREVGIPIAAASRYVRNLVHDCMVSSYWSLSRTEDPAASRELLNVLDLVQHFQHLEIFPSKKFAHFEKYVEIDGSLIIPEVETYTCLYTLCSIRRNSGVDYKDMLFFDDEPRNIRDISTIGKAMMDSVHAYQLNLNDELYVCTCRGNLHPC